MSSSLPICLIPGDPDIAGIGVRISVYIQGCLSIFSSIYFLHTARLFVKELRADPSFSQENGNIESEDENEESLPGYIKSFKENSLEYSEIAKALERSLFMVGFAVIVSAILDARSGAGITPYHLIIVLNISQINHWAGFLLLRSQGGLIFAGVGWTKQLFPKINLKDTGSILCIVHSCILSGLGIYYWSWIDKKPFLVYAADSDTPCTPFTSFWSFHSIDASSNALRIVSLLYYSLSVVPVLSMYVQNLMVEIIIGAIFLTAMLLYSIICITVAVLAITVSIALRIALCIPVCIFACCCGVPAHKRHGLHAGMVNDYVSGVPSPMGYAHDFYNRTPNPLITALTESYYAAPVIYTIVATEMMIRTNKPHVDSAAESKWTYGQTLALFTALIAVALYFSDLWKLIQRTRKRRSDLEAAQGG